MSERPIPFRDWEVRAILKGDKTLTRRVMKPQPAPFVQSTPDRHPTTRTDPYIDAYCGERKTPENPRGMSRDWHWWTADNRLGRLVARCPYGAPGDLLWVRETWAQYPIELNPEPCDAWYKATSNGPPPPFKWRPSIHMACWASRITLRITDVRVERLQDIEGQHPSESDAIAEGVRAIHHGDGDYYYSAFRDVPHPKNWSDPADAFREVWNSINGAGAWEANPWVWVIAFERVKP